MIYLLICGCPGLLVPVDRQKVKKLSERPNPGFRNVDRGFFVIGNKINQMPIFNSFNRPDFKSFQEGFEFVQPGGQRLNGTVRKVRKPIYSLFKI